MSGFCEMLRVVFGLALTSILAVESPLLAQDEAASDSMIAAVVETVDGVRIQCQIRDQQIQWDRVSRTGKSSNVTFSLAEVSQVSFPENTVDQQLAIVRSMVAQLADDDYHQREAAEQTLRKIGAPFREIILASSEEATAIDVKYRLMRVLKILKRNRAGSDQVSFGIVRKKSGTIIRGDSPEFRITGKFLDIPVAFDRTNVRSLTLVQQTVQSGRMKPGVAATQGYRASDDFARLVKPSDLGKPATQTINFDRGPDQDRLPTFTDLATAYLDDGVLFECEGGGKNKVATDGYSIQGQSGRNSAATYDYEFEKQRVHARYKGTFRATLVENGVKFSRAGSRRVWAYLKTVNPPRTIVMEAYNRDDELVGRCEAFQPTSFVGIESDELIEYVRIHTNHDLEATGDTKLDIDYAVDDFGFEAPVAYGGSLPDRYVVQTISAGFLTCESVRFEGDEVKLVGMPELDKILPNQNNEGPKELAIRRDRVLSITPPASRLETRAADYQAFVRLKGGSVVGIERFADSGVPDFPSMKLNRDEVVALWGRNQTCRHALETDFETNTPVIVVFPTLRSRLDDIDLTPERVSWDADAAEIRKQFEEEVPGIVDPTPGNEFELADAPTIWLQRPSDHLGQTTVRLTDGQRFVIGAPGDFTIKALTGSSVTIARGDDELEVPLSQVRSIQFGHQ